MHNTNKALKYGQRLFKFAQSGKISPKLVVQLTNTKEDHK